MGSKESDMTEQLSMHSYIIYAILFNKYIFIGFPGGLRGKELPANAGDTGDTGSIPGAGRSPGGGYDNPL